VRELQNLIERAVISSDNGVLANRFSTLNVNPAGANRTNPNFVVLPSAQEGTFRDSQRALILRALHASGWVVGGPRGAAASLGLKRTTLITKMKKLGISRPVWQTDIAGLSRNRETEQRRQPTE
jgi:transcriptional regulator with GAF, ATPase, and Fis domain